MIDERELLRRASETIASPEDVMSSLIRRRDRKRRNQRIGVGFLALVIAAAGIGAVSMLRFSDRSTPAHRPPGPMSRYHRNGALVVVDPSGHLTTLDPTGRNRVLFRGSPDLSLSPATPGGMFYRMAISPDGRKIAYVAARYGRDPSPGNDQLGIYVLDLRSGKATRIFPCEPVDCHALSGGIAWSPDGSRIAVSQAGGRITLMNSDGGFPHVVVDLGDQGNVFGRLTWSPDDTSLAFMAGNRGKGASVRVSLFVVGADGSGLSAIVTRPLHADGTIPLLDPAWSPDGSMIAYGVLVPVPGTSRSTGQLWMVNPDGGGRRKVFQTGPPCFIWCGAGPVWAPDGTEIAYLGPENRIYVMNSDGSDPRPIVSARFSTAWPDLVWQPLP
jgi:dipeptidyl aminopeptidase/acylaminoacyl peptidase